MGGREVVQAGRERNYVRTLGNTKHEGKRATHWMIKSTEIPQHHPASWDHSVNKSVLIHLFTHESFFKNTV